ncbi:hypothetical protein MCELHM10_00775 [Paracoccaceae bacterium]
MRFTNIAVLGMVTIGLSACQPTELVVMKATPNLISFSYDAYGTTPTLTADALDRAIEHCKAQGGLYANYRGVTVPNPLSANEVHTFVCEKTKTDDGAVIAAQNAQYGAASAASAAIFAESFEKQIPIQTQCTVVGQQTYCTSY